MNPFNAPVVNAFPTGDPDVVQLVIKFHINVSQNTDINALSLSVKKVIVDNFLDLKLYSDIDAIDLRHT